MAKLTKETRDGLPAEDFAVPGKRALPIHDETHTRMAWDMVSKTKGLTEAERKEARRRIIERARKLGIDTSHFEKGRLNASVSLCAMALNISNDDGHPNKMPFSGIMARIDQPSDAPPEGSGGRLITISAEAAEGALSSLLGMAVDYRDDQAGHDPQNKVGVITAATIEGDAILIEGFIYAADFPEIAAEIKASKEKLGFSYEARNLYTNDPEANPMVITECVFTGAAILRKDKAAYRTTAIAAAREDEDMTPEQEKALNDAVAGIAALTSNVATLSASVATMQKGPDKVEANANTIALVEPHAKALEAAADAMCAAGIGADAQSGHAVALRRIAGNMRASAAMGHVPSSLSRYEYANAAADHGNRTETVDTAKQFSDALKPINDALAALGTKVADIQAAATATAPAPERKTLSPSITSLLARAGITAPEKDGEKIPIAKLDEAMKDMPVDARLQAKAALRQASLID